MLIHFTLSGQRFHANLSRPLDISIPLKEDSKSVICFDAPSVEFAPVIADNFIGSTEKGGPVNFFNIKINPHGNGTHTECVGHIAKEKFTINQSLKKFHFLAKLVSVFPKKMDNGDRLILKEQLEEVFPEEEVEALIIRTLPNKALKLRTNYSNSNPPYLHWQAVAFLVEKGVRHLLIDLPSVDKEQDGGKLLAHRAFWRYPGTSVRQNCTITELVFVKNEIKDGFYLLNIQIASFEIDVSPSKPVLYELVRA